MLLFHCLISLKLIKLSQVVFMVMEYSLMSDIFQPIQPLFHNNIIFLLPNKKSFWKLTFKKQQINKLANLHLQIVCQEKEILIFSCKLFTLQFFLPKSLIMPIWTAIIIAKGSNEPFKLVAWCLVCGAEHQAKWYHTDVKMHAAYKEIHWPKYTTAVFLILLLWTYFFRGRGSALHRWGERSLPSTPFLW